MCEAGLYFGFVSAILSSSENYIGLCVVAATKERHILCTGAGFLACLGPGCTGPTQDACPHEGPGPCAEDPCII